MYLLLAISLVSLVVIALYLCGWDFLSPSVMFLVGFLACVFGCLYYVIVCEFDPAPQTVLVLVVGCATFVMVTALVKNWQRPLSPVAPGSLEADRWMLQPNKCVLYAGTVLQAIVFVWTLAEISALYPADSITASIDLYDEATKFSSENAVTFPKPLLIARNLCGAFALLAIYQLAQNLACKDRAYTKVLIISFVLALGVSMETGGRTGAIGYIVYAAVAYALVRRRITGRQTALNIRVVFRVLAAGAFILLTFQASLSLLGRTSTQGFIEYLAIYVGAEIPNLDIFLQGEFPVDTDVWGYMTFITSIKWLGQKLGISGWVYQIDLPFQRMGGHGLGNVYTTFYAPLYDFGILGMLVLVALMAAISQLVYEQVRRCNGGAYCIWVIAYVLIAYTLLMSFFSNKFYESIFCIGMVRTMLYLAVWLIVYSRVRFKLRGRRTVDVLREGKSRDDAQQFAITRSALATRSIAMRHHRVSDEYKLYAAGPR